MNNKANRKQAFKLALHHLWSRILLLFSVLIVLLAIGLIIIRASTPLLAKHHQNIQDWLEQRLHYPVQFGQVEAGWKGFEPIIRINDVSIENDKHQPLIHLDHFAIGFNLFQTLLYRQLKIGLVVIRGATLKIVNSADGMTVIYGNTPIPIAQLKPNSQGNGKLIDDLFLINKIHLDTIQVIWQKPTGQIIQFQNVMLEMLNNGEQHHAWGLAATNQPEKSQLAFVANIQGNIINKKTLKGSVYFHGNNLELKEWLPGFQFKNLLVNDGFLSGEIWMKIDKGIIADLQGGLTASNVTLSNIKTKQKTQINNLSGNIAWQKKADSWTVSADHVILNNNAINEPAESLFLNYSNSPSEKQPSITAFLQYAPISWLTPVSNFLGYLPIESAIKKYSAAGDLQNIYLNFTDKSQFDLAANFNNIAFQMSKEVSISNLNGIAYLFPTIGELDIQSNNLHLKIPAIPKQSIILNNSFLNKFYWQYNQKILTVKSPAFQISDPDMAIQGNVFSSIPIKNPTTARLDLNVNTNTFPVTILKNYLPQPKDSHVHLFDFFHDGFLAGTATAQMNFNGQLNRFPFVHHSGNFTVNAKFNNLSLLFKNDWMPLTNVNGSMNITNQTLTGMASQAKFYGTPITNLTAVIPNIKDQLNPNITIKADVQTTLEHAMAFIHHSPLEHTIGKKLQHLTFQGPANLRLNMNFSLKADDHKHLVEGNLTTQNAIVDLPEWGLQFTNTTGELNFNNEAITANHLTANFLQQPVTASINTINADTKKSVMQLQLTGKFLLDYLKSKIDDRFINRLTGAVNYTAQLQIFDNNFKQDNLTVNSNLIGMEINLPAPFTKQPNATEALTVKIIFANGNIKSRTDKSEPVAITASLGRQINFQSVLQKIAGKLHFISGNLHLGSGNARPQSDKGLLIDGSVPSFVWQEWKPLLTSDSDKSSEISSAIRLVNINIKQLNFYSHLFFNTQVQAVYKNNNWALSFNGPAIAGNLTPPSKARPIVEAHLTRLYLNTDAKTKSKSAPVDIAPSEIPSLDFNIDDFRYGALKLGRLALQTSPTPTGLTIKQFDTISNALNFHASGFWKNTNKLQYSGLQGILAAGNAKDLFSGLGYPNSFSAKNLQLKFDLQWPGSVFNPSMSSVSGMVNLQTGSGVINDIGSKANNDMAMGQLLTFLSVQSLQRRLTLNFNDLTRKGFSFDTLHGDFHLAKGLASTKNTIINGIVATINFKGDIDIINKEFDLELRVTPKVTSSIPIIATIAGGPVIGAATWVVNKLFSPAVNQIAAKYFHLGGSWSHPKVTPMNSVSMGDSGKESPFV